jgi:uncharacterized membrane protein
VNGLSARVFLIAAAAAGLAFTFVTPPFRVPDEVGHLWRAVGIAYGDVLPRSDARGSYSAIPNGIRMLPFAMGASETRVRRDHFTNAPNLELAESDRRIAHYPAGYTPVPYAPQIAAAFLGRTFDVLPIALFYLGRLFNLAAFIATIWLAIRIAPGGPWIFCAAALLPMSLYLAASWSPDAMTIALAFLFTAMVFRPDESSLRLAAAGFLLALCKPAYFLIALVALVQQKRRTAAMAVAAALLGATLALANAARAQTPRPDVKIDSAAQIRCLTEDPIRFVRFFGRHLAANAFEYSEQMIGRLGMLDIKLPAVAVWSEIALLLAAALAGGRLSARVRVVSAAVVVISTTGIFLSMYVGYSRSCNVLEGVQGRYFLPLVPLALSVAGVSLRSVERVMPALTLAVAVSANAAGVVWVALRYYYY